MAVWLLASGCSKHSDIIAETDERTYRRAKSLQREGRYQEALGAYLELIDERKIAPESHLEAGLIYLNSVNEPLSAIYHFKRYLHYKPDSDKAELVNEQISSANKEYLRQLPAQPYADEVQRMDLSKKLEEVRGENLKLREDLVVARRSLETANSHIQQLETALGSERPSTSRPPTQVAPIVVTPGSPGNSPNTYTVEAGDTLSKISRKVYGDSGRFMDIFQANRDQMASPNSLRVGQVLKIP